MGVTAWEGMTVTTHALLRVADLRRKSVQLWQEEGRGDKGRQGEGGCSLAEADAFEARLQCRMVQRPAAPLCFSRNNLLHMAEYMILVRWCAWFRLVQ